MTPNILTARQVDHFIDRGYVLVQDCIPKAMARQWVDSAFTRLGYDAGNPQTWTEARIHLPPSRYEDARQLSPRAFGAICDLVGGAERISEPVVWADTFVVNLREGADRPYDLPSARVSGWHKDGYFFKHFLDSPEQGLLVIVAWTDVLSRGGGTFIAPDSVGVVARYLAEHPEGVSPAAFAGLIDQCHDFMELTASAGDVVLMHPYMLHAVSQNHLRVPRIISNPPVFLREPMRFHRPDPADLSPVERGVLRGLGVDDLDFQPTAPRQTEMPGWMVKAQQSLGGGKSSPTQV